MLYYVDSFFSSAKAYSSRALPFAAEAAWSTGKWQHLEKLLSSFDTQGPTPLDFNVGIGKSLLALRRGDAKELIRTLALLRDGVARGLSPTTTASLHAAHDCLVKLHVLYEIETIGGMTGETAWSREEVLPKLDRRLKILGAYTSDKQYLLGIRRAAMQLARGVETAAAGIEAHGPSLRFTKFDIASVWLTSARLARKANFTTTAYRSALHAAQLGDDASRIEYAKLLWKDGQHRKAIQSLQGAIEIDAFQARISVINGNSVYQTVDQQQAQNQLTARAQLLLAKWLDQAGQTKSELVKDQYLLGARAFTRWDKGHYYLGRYYNKILEAEKQLPQAKQNIAYMCGEVTKLVIENYIRSLPYGTKYYYQTIPKLLTLWLDLGEDVQGPAPAGLKEFAAKREEQLKLIHRSIKKYSQDRVPTYAWYTAFPQMITRISHPNPDVWEVLSDLIGKVASAYPQQALWSLLAVTRATSKVRVERGRAVATKLKVSDLGGVDVGGGTDRWPGAEHAQGQCSEP